MKILIDRFLIEEGEAKGEALRYYSTIKKSDDGKFVEIWPADSGQYMLKIPMEVFYGFDRA